jgi:hypothetical protein
MKIFSFSFVKNGNFLISEFLCGSVYMFLYFKLTCVRHFPRNQSQLTVLDDGSLLNLTSMASSGPSDVNGGR